MSAWLVWFAFSVALYLGWMLLGLVAWLGSQAATRLACRARLIRMAGRMLRGR